MLFCVNFYTTGLFTNTRVYVIVASDIRACARKGNESCSKPALLMPTWSIRNDSRPVSIDWAKLSRAHIRQSSWTA